MEKLQTSVPQQPNNEDAQAEITLPAVAGTITSLMGEVIATSPSGDQRMLAEGDAVFPGETIMTGDFSLLILRMPDGSRKGVAANAEARIEFPESWSAPNPFLEPTLPEPDLPESSALQSAEPVQETTSVANELTTEQPSEGESSDAQTASDGFSEAVFVHRNEGRGATTAETDSQFETVGLTDQTDATEKDDREALLNSQRSTREARLKDELGLDPLIDTVIETTTPVTEVIGPVGETVIETVTPVIEVIEPVEETVVEITAPVIEVTEPAEETVVENTAPVIEVTEPAEETVVENTAPVIEVTEPAEETVVENTAPVIEVTEPAEETVVANTAPVIEVTEPAEETVVANTAPVIEVTEPAEETVVANTAPVIEVTEPAEETVVANTAPVIEVTEPAEETVVENTAPVIEVIDPVVETVPEISPAQDSEVIGQESPLVMTEAVVTPPVPASDSQVLSYNDVFSDSEDLLFPMEEPGVDAEMTTDPVPAALQTQVVQSLAIAEPAFAGTSDLSTPITAPDPMAEAGLL